MRLHGDSLSRRVLWSLLLAVGCQRTPAPSLATPTDSTLRAPDGSALPTGNIGRSILRGHAILAATRDSLPNNVGNKLRCTSCHLGDGRRPNAIPLVGVYARYPQYRTRTANVQRLEDRVNDCLLRSMNGRALAWDDPAMRDIVTYLAWLSKGIAVGDWIPGQGLPLTKATPADTAGGGDVAGGKAVFARSCARCHAADGSGTAVAPPVWGPQSFSIGAGMARRLTAAAFVRHNMPFDAAGTLSQADADAVAAYITSQPRPDFVGKENDWPHGDAPVDAAYPTRAGHAARP